MPSPPRQCGQKVFHYTDMKKRIILTTFLLLLAAVSSGVTGDRTTVLNEQFFTDLAKVSVLRRDDYITHTLKGTVTGDCIISKTDTLQRYDRKYRIVGTKISSGFTFHYYFFTESKSLHDSVQEGHEFTFSGTFMSLTPLNMKKDSYIIDIKLAVPENDD